MPRIAPLQLIKCLSVLLTPGGGIKSTDEVARLVMLMQRFSKKLVSKCVYVSILKNTELGLLSDFMEHGGWALVFMWLEKGIDAQNWLFIKETLELLMICPVDVARLKSNNIPKLVKSLSKNNQIGGEVQDLAAKTVAKWLAIVKGIPVPAEVPPSATTSPPPADKEEEEEEKGSEAPAAAAPVPVLKIKINKDANKRRAIIQEDDSDTTSDQSDSSSSKSKVKAVKKSEESRSKSSSSHKDRDHDKKSSSSSSSSKQKSSSNSSSSDKHRSSEHRSSSDKSKSSRDKDRSSKSSSSSSSAKNYLKDKEREREKDRERAKRKEKEREEKESAKLTKMEKDRQIETDQATLARLMVPSINKLGKIPKKTDKTKINELKENIKSESGEKKDKPVAPPQPPEVSKKNYSFSIEKRTPSDQKPKTVKTFNAKPRSTGLEEETTKPPPPRAKTSSSSSSSSSSKHSSSSSSLSSSIEKKPTKRPSPSKELPPEKKLKTSSDPPTHPSGGSSPHQTTGSSSPNDKLKVTPPKPKVMFLQESDVFSSALNDAILVKDTKKKKRKLSKDDPKDIKDSKEPKVTSPTSQKPPEDKPTFKFYRDTLDSTLEESKKQAPTESDESEADAEAGTGTPPGSPGGESVSPTQPKQRVEKCNIDVVSRPPDQPLKGVLSYLKAAKRPKKNVHWRSVDEGFENVFYFELDETERCNVSRPNSFTDMRSMERELERENFHIARKISQEDVQEERTVWTGLIPMETEKPLCVEMGKNSREKEIQKARQMVVKPTIYGGYNVIPPSPAEPDFEVHVTTDPVIMPTEDSSAEPSTIDFSAIPWPEPVATEQFYPMGAGPAGPMMAVPGAMMAPGPGGPPMGMMPGMFPPGPPGGPVGPNGPFPAGPPPPNAGTNWMGGPVDISQAGGMPPNMNMGGPMPPFPPGMGPPGMGPGPPLMGMNMGMMGPGGPMPPDMMMGGSFPPMGPPGMFGPPGGPPGGFNGPPGPWFGPGGPGPDVPGLGPPIQGPPNNMDMYDNNGEGVGGKPPSRSKPSGGSWHRGGGEPSRDRDRERDRDRDRDRDKRGRGHRSTIPCRHKRACKNRDCQFMHPR
uniref:Serine/threonine-protein phosphatase 1 regulatory subunit 10 n=1 Tax=Cacopsylla melanoneura TaxID=428564 RepID=A0A8D8S9U6_9HEMI